MPRLDEQLQGLRDGGGRVCFLGIGNVDGGDDAFGMRLAEALTGAGVPDVVLAGTTPEMFVARMEMEAGSEPFAHIVFLDAVDFGGEPGSAVFLNAEEMTARFPQISTHRLSLGLLASWVESNGRTKAWLLGAQPETLRPGRELTATLRTTQAALQDLVVRHFSIGGGGMMTPEQAIVAAIITCLGGAVLTLILSHFRTLAGWITVLVTVASAVMVFGAVIHVLTAGPSAHAAAFWEMPQFGFALRLYVDGLTALFLALAATIAVPAALYSVTYMRHYHEYSVARYYPHFLVFLAAMYGLVSTTDMMWFFFMFWQMMTLPGYALIRFENKKRENIHAANKYLLMMQIACVATMVGAELLAASGAAAVKGSVRYDFDTVSANLPALLSQRPAAGAVAFGLFLVGFGIKMGMWPFGQVWLPDAHPAAPSPVSAMLSGVMIKTGVYGLLRYFLWLVPHDAWKDYPLSNWGMVVATLGTITLFTGTMQALKQEQSKRLLAFHSIGQIGYILLGIGACMALLPVGGVAGEALATVALMGALFHVLNHGLFKGLLFLNAGSLLHATGTQDLNKMGGLMKFMPLTAITAIIASFSISGVPLFNGFASKWAIYVATVQGGGMVRYLPVFAIIAMLTSALTLASFIKFFGVSFLSRTSDLVKEQAAKRGRLEVGLWMQLPQVFLAGMCVLLGVVPALAFNLLQTAMNQSQQGYGAVFAKASPLSQDAVRGIAVSGIDKANTVALFTPLLLAAVVLVMFVMARLLTKLGGATRRAAAPWLCGYVREANCHRYVAHNFYSEIKRYFKWLGGMPHALPPVVPPTPEPSVTREGNTHDRT